MPVSNDVSSGRWQDYEIKPKEKTTTSPILGKDASEMDMDDFFTLLIAQMTNQDIMNPKNDTEYVAQMAQFSALKGVQTIQEYQLSSYATSYVGKYVAIANVNDKGEMERVVGQVEMVTFYDGKPQVIVGGKRYDLHTVMEVSATEIPKVPPSTDKDKEDDKDTDPDKKPEDGDKPATDAAKAAKAQENFYDPFGQRDRDVAPDDQRLSSVAIKAAQAKAFLDSDPFGMRDKDL